jgi:hypothetical protein
VKLRWVLFLRIIQKAPDLLAPFLCGGIEIGSEAISSSKKVLTAKFSLRFQGEFQINILAT